MSQSTMVWKGHSGKRYEYVVYGLNASWNNKPGNYIFAKRTASGWHAIYVGQTDSFASRLPNHNERGCAVRNGATHVHAHVNSAGESSRKFEEVDLIREHQPACNQQHKAA